MRTLIQDVKNWTADTWVSVGAAMVALSAAGITTWQTKIAKGD